MRYIISTRLSLFCVVHRHAAAVRGALCNNYITPRHVTALSERAGHGQGCASIAALTIALRPYEYNEGLVGGHSVHFYF